MSADLQVLNDRGTGHCCRHFNMGVSLEDLRARAREVPDDQELVMIVAMLIPIGTRKKDGKQTYDYTCRHLQENGDGGIYALRPKMCRDHPDQGAYATNRELGCVFPGCTWAAKSKGIPLPPDDEIFARMIDWASTGRGGFAGVQQE